MKTVLRLFSLSIILFLLSCAIQRIDMPVYEGVDVKDVLSSKNRISAIETTFSIIFEKDDTEIRGDATLNISRNGNLSLRVYSLGFLALELTSDNGVIKSNPSLDRNKSAILTFGLKDCLFWWDIKDFEIDERDDTYILKNLSRKIWIDRKTMLPRKQIISLEDGRELKVYYEGSEKEGDIWYPAKMKLELSKYSVTLRIKSISFTI
ncbi:MAG: hypothetical protein HZA07_00190 [Nitrospirae bacterium]|nr:hypothetical protein [Nitrospirota bacterium]